MQRLSITCETLEQLSFIKSFTDSPDIDFLRLTRILGESIDVLVSANKLPSFKHVLAHHNIKYTVTVEDVEQAVREEALLNNIARLRSTAAATSEPFDYYPRYVTASKSSEFLF